LTNQKTLFGHPVGLFYLFFVELWERFSYYGMRALLVLYVVDEFYQTLPKDERKILALGIFGAYGALVYATPVLGGMIADKFIGYRKSIMLGGIIMTLGHFCMALQNEISFFIALGLLVVGNGFFKPNIASMVGTLYGEKDSRRDGGFTIFYMGVNVGAMLAPLVCGWLGYAYGWHLGFGAAGVGMLLGLLVFWFGLKKNVLGDRGTQPEQYREKKVVGLGVDKIIYILGFAVVPLFALMIFFNGEKVFGQNLMGFILLIILGTVLSIIFYRFTKITKVEWNRMAVIVVLTFFIMVFWSFFEQAGSSLVLFAEENVNLVLINAAQTNSINPFYIMLLAVPFSMMWLFLSKFGKNPLTPIKSGLGLIQLGIGFLIFALSAHYVDVSGQVPFFFLLLGYLFLTTGELFISPIGLSKATELSPAKYVAFMVGVFYMSSSFAHYIVGGIAKLTVMKPTTEYVEQSGFRTSFIENVTGTEQNAKNKFAYELSSTYEVLSDTNIHDKTIIFENKETKDSYTITLNKYSAISDSIGNMNKKLEKGKYEPKDTVLQLVESRVRYTTAEEFDNYLGALELMKEVSQWNTHATSIIGQAENIRGDVESLSSSTDVDLRAQYWKLKQSFYRLKGNTDVNKAFNLLVQKESMTEIEFDEGGAWKLQKLQKTTPESIEKARLYIGLKKELRANNAEWADAAISVVENTHSNKVLAQSFLNLGSYTGVFALIGLAAILIALFAFIFTPWLKKWMHGVH